MQAQHLTARQPCPNITWWWDRSPRLFKWPHALPLSRNISSQFGLQQRSQRQRNEEIFDAEQTKDSPISSSGRTKYNSTAIGTWLLYWLCDVTVYSLQFLLASSAFVGSRVVRSSRYSVLTAANKPLWPSAALSVFFLALPTSKVYLQTYKAATRPLVRQ